MTFATKGFADKNFDLTGRLKTTQHQNIYDADFEYGPQPLRWEAFTNGSAAIAHLPNQGGVRLAVSATNGDIAIRQSRPYHRYQPGKMMYMATACLFGLTQTNTRQRVGFFDDSNGVFFEQADATATNPSGMGVVLRTDVGGVPYDQRIGLDQWNGDDIRFKLDFNSIQMFFIEFTWYGAGSVRFGVIISGEPYILHTFARGNTTTSVVGSISGTTLNVTTANGSASLQVGAPIAGLGITAGTTITALGTGTGGVGTYTLSNSMNVASTTITVNNIVAWARTGNLPSRYELRNVGTAPAATTMIHYGVSVIVDGQSDPQRGFTYSYGMAPTTPRRTVALSTTRYPVLSIRPRIMGTQEYTQVTAAITAGTTTTLTAGTAAWTVNQWTGRFVNYFASGVSYIARITSNTATVLTIADPVIGGPVAVAPVAGQNYTIGLINRGQLLPRRLMISASSLATVELITSTPTSPVVLTGASFAALSSLGSPNSFAERDVSATALTGGEVTFAFVAPAGGSGLQDIDLSFYFPLVTNIRGAIPDVLSVAITTPSAAAADVGVHLICQEAMS